MNLKKFDAVIISRFHETKPNTGVTKALIRLSKCLEEIGFTICIIAESKNGVLRIETRQKISVYYVPIESNKFLSMLRRKLPHFAASWIESSLAHMPDCRFILAPNVGLQTAILKFITDERTQKIALVYTPYTKTNPLGLVLYFFQKRSLGFADAIVGPSRAILRKLNLQENNSTKVIPFEARQIFSSTSSVPNIDHPPYFLWIGSLTYRKGIHRLLNIIIIGKKNLNLKIVWSKSRYYYVPLIALKMLRRVGKVELYSDLTEARLDFLMQNAEALIMTSSFESFGLVVLEAATFSTGTIFVGPPEITEVLPQPSGGSLFFANTRALTEFLKHEPPLVDFKVLGAKANNYTSESLSSNFVKLEWRDFFLSLSRKNEC